MDLERLDSRADRSDDMDAEDSPYRDRRGGGDDVDFKEDGAKESRKKSGSRRDEKDHRSKDRERDDKVSSRDRRREDRDDREKDKRKDYKDERDEHRDKEYDRERGDRKDRGKERERGEVVKEDKGKERNGREKGRDKYREKDRGRDREKEAESRDKERLSRKADHPPEHDDRNKDEPDSVATGRGQNSENVSAERRISTNELQERIQRAKEERTKKKGEGASELLDWVNKSRKLEEKRNAEKEKAAQLSKMFEEQDNMGHEESDDEEGAPSSSDHLAGVKVLHGLDKVVEGGAVVLTLKDQSILADGDINEEVDMLENVEIGEQKRRDDAYKAAKKKTGIYTDKFSDDPDAEKRMLPQYDDPTEDEGVTLDARGHITGEAEKKLEELRKRLQSAPNSNHFEDLTSTAKVSLDYYTQEEMVQFKKPKKKKSLRKKEKLNIDALEAEAVAAGLGVGDLGSRNDRNRQAIREKEEQSEAERRSNAYQSAYAKAEEASKSLRMELTSIKEEDEESNGIADDDEDLYKSLEKARKLALTKQNEKRASGPEAVALLASTILSPTQAAEQNSSAGEQLEDRIVITEMEEFVGGLQLDEESRIPDREDVFMDEDDAPASDHEQKDEDGGWGEVKETANNEVAAEDNEEDIAPDETIHETAVGKGLSGALKLLQDRGALKESVEWGGRNMDKKKSKLVGLTDQEGGREIRIERLDEFGRTLTPKEAFRLLSHKFHGKGPGKMKQEKRMKQYYEDLKLKQMKNADTPSLSAERMREAQAQLKTPYLVLSGHVKPGQNSDPRSGFATVEKDLGSLTPMLGDRKVEHFLGIKRKPDASSSGSVKKPKT